MDLVNFEKPNKNPIANKWMFICEDRAGRLK